MRKAFTILQKLATFWKCPYLIFFSEMRAELFVRMTGYFFNSHQFSFQIIVICNSAICNSAICMYKQDYEVVL